MSEILFSLIQKGVFKEKEIKSVSLNATSKEYSWIFDFKAEALTKVFLEEYSRCFWKFFEDTFIDKIIQIGGMESGAVSLVTGVTLFAPKDISVQSFYIRKSRKKSDLAQRVEGVLDKRLPVILVDDILNSGDSIRKQVAILEEEGCHVVGVFTCVRFREMIEYRDLIDKGIIFFDIFELDDFKDILPVQNLKKILNTTTLSNTHYSIDYKIRLTDKPNLYLVAPKSGPILIGDYMYMGVDDGSFYCILAETGAIVWVYKITFGVLGKHILSTCSIYKDKVIFGAYDGNVYCLNRFSGKRNWVFMDADWVGSSPCIDQENGIIFIGLEFGLFSKKGGIVAIDIDSGKAIWKEYTMPEYTHASPSYSKKFNIVVCGCNDTFIYAFDASNGKLLWKFKTKGEVKYGSVFDEKRGLVVIASMDGNVYLINIQDGSLYYSFSARFGFYTTPVLFGDLVIIGSLDKKVYCFDSISKTTKWAFETGGRIFSTPLIKDTTVFIGSNDGAVYELDVFTGNVLNRTQLTERIVNMVQIDATQENKKILYVATQVCELYKLKEI
jgi:outer membrane protein assembly factor BamB/orotate phosphoribosyltransferase